MVSLHQAVDKLQKFLDFSSYLFFYFLFFESAQEKNLLFSKFRKLSEKVSAKRGKYNPALQLFQMQQKKFW